MADLGCSPNAAVAFDYLIERGLHDYQAAAVVGNLQHESRLDPRLDAIDSNGLPSRGIAMWQPPRWQNLLAFAAGRDPWSLDVQLDFLWYELPNFGLNALAASTTLEDATVVFQNSFEKPKASLAHTSNRIAYARAALYACPLVRPPHTASRAGLVAAAVGVVALVGAVGYGIYKVIASREPAPEPRPPRPVFPLSRFEPEPVRRFGAP